MKTIHPIHKAMAGLALSQQLSDKFNTPAPTEAPQQPPVEAPQTPQEAPQQAQPQETPKDEVGLLTGFMDEVRALFKGKEDEEKKTQELISKHEKDMGDIKQGLTELLNEESKQN